MNNPVVVITGATGATGTFAAKSFARQGASLALLSSNQIKLDKLEIELNLPAVQLFTVVADLRNPVQVNAAAASIYAKFGRADILLHLVGGWTGGKSLVDTPGGDLEAMVGQHVWTTFHLAQAFIAGMVNQRWGRFIIVSSPTATTPPPKMGAYATAKAAQETLLLTLAQEVKDSGVTANIIQVRSIDTNDTGQGTTADEITAAMHYLCSDKAAKINGARIPLF